MFEVRDYTGAGTGGYGDNSGGYIGDSQFGDVSGFGESVSRGDSQGYSGDHSG